MLCHTFVGVGGWMLCMSSRTTHSPQNDHAVCLYLPCGSGTKTSNQGRHHRHKLTLRHRKRARTGDPEGFEPIDEAKEVEGASKPRFLTPNLHDGANRIGLAYGNTVLRRVRESANCWQQTKPSCPKSSKGGSTPGAFSLWRVFILLSLKPAAPRPHTHLRSTQMRCQSPDTSHVSQNPLFHIQHLEPDPRQFGVSAALVSLAGRADGGSPSVTG